MMAGEQGFTQEDDGLDGVDAAILKGVQQAVESAREQWRRGVPLSLTHQGEQHRGINKEEGAGDKGMSLPTGSEPPAPPFLDFSEPQFTVSEGQPMRVWAGELTDPRLLAATAALHQQAMLPTGSLRGRLSLTSLHTRLACMAVPLAWQLVDDECINIAARCNASASEVQSLGFSARVVERSLKQMLSSFSTSLEHDEDLLRHMSSCTLERCETLDREPWSFEYELVVKYRITKKRLLRDTLYRLGRLQSSCSKDEHNKQKFGKVSILVGISCVILFSIAYAARYNKAMRLHTSGRISLRKKLKERHVQ